jgi:hypothetical protein
MPSDMTAGVFAVVGNDAGRLESDFYPDPPGSFDREKIEVRSQSDNDAQTTFTSFTEDFDFEWQTGKLYASNVADNSSVVLTDDGDVIQREWTDNETSVVDFAYIPNQVFVVDKSKHTFAFDIVERLTGARVRRAEVDVRSFVDDFENPDVSSETVTDRHGNMDTATGSGTHVNQDQEFQRIRSDSKRSIQAYLKTGPSDHRNLNLHATENGYIRIYSPTNRTDEFLHFIVSDLWSYVTNIND